MFLLLLLVIVLIVLFKVKEIFGIMEKEIMGVVDCRKKEDCIW